MKKNIIYTIPIIAAILAGGCSVKKNTLLSRSYHNLTAHYNIVFNGEESFNNGILKVEKSVSENEKYNNLLPVFIFSDPTVARTMLSDMDRSIKKSSKVIQFHSITAKPKRKKGNPSEKEKLFYEKNEYNKWIDDAYYLMGRAHFHKHDFYPAIESLEFLIRQFSDNPIRFKAYIWLARVHIEQKKYERASNIMDLLRGDNEFPDKLTADLALTEADYYLRQKKNEEAIPALILAIDNLKSKRTRARYKYLLAQIYEKNGDDEKASEIFGEVIQMNPAYKMLFSATMRRASLITAENEDIDAIIKRLNKMLKDDKNIDYVDQIYYALGNIALKEGKKEEAIGFYRKSALESFSNDHQKALSFLSLGKIYYADPDYKNAQIYYDSANTFIDKEFEESDDIKKLSLNLNRLVDNINLIEREDSLQMVASMDEAERDELIQGIIDKIIEEESLKKEKEAEERLMGQTGRPMMAGNMNRGGQQSAGLGMTGNTGMGGGSGWYFYNPSAVSFGQVEFTKKWGRRKLEDNWRRMNKAIQGIEESNSDEGDVGGYEDITLGSDKKSGLNIKSKEYYIEDLPLTDSLIEISNYRMVQAYFNIGKVYKEDFKDFDRSIENFLILIDRFPENDKLLFTYYNLYQIYTELGNTTEEEIYKNYIINDFPDSRSAKIVSNPNYFIELEEGKKLVTQYYSDTYQLFLLGNYEGVIDKCILADSTFERNHLRSVFSYLKVLSMGESGQYELPVLQNELIKLTASYPDSEVAKPANALLNFIRTGDSEASISGNITAGGAGEEMEMEEPEPEIYIFDETGIHYYILLPGNKKTNINELKFKITDFNTSHYSTEFHDVSSLILNKNFHLITVKKFEGKEKASNYFNALNENGMVFENMEETDYRQFIISQENYKTFYEDKDVAKYLKFYTKYYENN